MKLNKKIKTEIALGIIISAAVVVGGLAWIWGNKQIGIAAIFSFKGKNTKGQNQNSEERILFASNGQRNIYKIKREDKWVVVVDDQESAAYDSVLNPIFSSDGSQFAYMAETDNQTVVVLNNTAQLKTYDNIAGLVFSSDGKQLAYVGNKNENYVVVINEKESKKYKNISTLKTEDGTYEYIVFSSDGRQAAFKASDGSQYFVVVNGQEGKRYDYISDFTFTSAGQFTYQAQLGNEQITVINNTSEIITGTATAGQSSDSSTNSSSDGSSSSSSSDGKDVHLDQGRLNHSPCNTKSSASGNCNF